MERYFLSFTLKNSSQLVMFIMNPGEEIFLTYFDFPQVGPSLKFSDRTASYYGVQLMYRDIQYLADQDNDHIRDCVDETSYTRSSKIQG